MAGKLNVQEMLDLKSASYQMAVMNDSKVEAVLKNTAKAQMLQKSLDSVASQMNLAVQMQAFVGFIKDEDKKKLVASQCDEALQKAVETMAAALS